MAQEPQSFDHLTESAKDLLLAAGVLAICSTILQASWFVFSYRGLLPLVFGWISLLTAIALLSAIAMPLLVRALHKAKEEFLPKATPRLDRVVGIIGAALITLTLLVGFIYVTGRPSLA